MPVGTEEPVDAKDGALRSVEASAGEGLETDWAAEAGPVAPEGTGQEDPMTFTTSTLWTTRVSES